MDALLVPYGSAGDLYPFVALGLALRARGHRVRVLTPAAAAPLAERAGLEVVRVERDGAAPGAGGGRLAAAVDGACRLALQLVGRRWRKLARASTILPWLRPVCEAVARLYVPGRTVVAASSLALGARLAHDWLGVPLATVHLSPALFRSAYQAPVLPPLVLPAWWSPRAKRAAYRVADALVLDRLLAGPLNAARAERGLPPVRRVLGDWRHSPQCVLGLFPAWFALPQPDWPARTHLTGFPLFDGGGLAEAPAGLQEFLDGGAPPVVFTPGTSIERAGRFFAESAEACRRLGCRGLLLTRFADQVPAALPPGVRHFPYVPFGRLLPRAAALVHYGGVGTLAQALAAGTPQLVVPRRHDQHDNAARLVGLGVAAALRPRAYRAAAVADALARLLTDPAVAARCRDAARRPFGGVDEACRLLERLAPLPLAPAA
jgi:UDP:flavonoid glycosyltransferase YjiC (YdhE family)